jgi:hypothetical protein
MRLFEMPPPSLKIKEFENDSSSTSQTQCASRIESDSAHFDFELIWAVFRKSL